jgi:hypothetical protein
MLKSLVHENSNRFLEQMSVLVSRYWESTQAQEFQNKKGDNVTRE